MLYLIPRTIKSVLSVWLDTFPEDFRSPPDYPCLSRLEAFARDQVPDSDLGVRTRHKREKFRKEDLGNSGMIACKSLYCCRFT